MNTISSTHDFCKVLLGFLAVCNIILFPFYGICTISVIVPKDFGICIKYPANQIYRPCGWHIAGERMRDSIANLPWANCMVLISVRRTVCFTNIPTTQMTLCPHPYRICPQGHGFSHGLTKCPPDTLLHQCVHWCRPFESLSEC